MRGGSAAQRAPLALQFPHVAVASLAGWPHPQRVVNCPTDAVVVCCPLHEL